MSTAIAPVVSTDPSNETGYRTFRLGKFELARDEYFVTVRWPAKGQMRSHQMSAEAFLSCAPACATSPGTSSTAG